MINHIVKSYIVGQHKEMVEQINEFGLDDFLEELRNYNINESEKYRILFTYLKIKG